MTIKNVDAKTVKQWLEEDKAVLLDVREPAEHATKKIAGAHLFPLSQIETGQLPNIDSKKLVLHCQAGKRSTTACQKLMLKHPEVDIYNLEGGIGGWIDSGFPVDKSNQFPLPLEQQVQVFVGTLLVLFSILAWLISPFFIAFTMFLGIGLVFAGISGYCGLAYVLAKMPWNQSSRNYVTCKKA
ncbi:rhodanese-like domain-containing protein [Legionella gresilensis]|uniref:rhodanese-like domain-containing protein n=1 Tax=Legionella gresilensis TaxID=91823 RepID=UPI00104157D3|nr:rhodanese-like domain-containing protein [Legionella gresilensis]